MKKAILISFIVCPFFSFGQTLYNPQNLYDSPGGLFDKDSLRDIYVNFQDPNYHNVFVNSFFIVSIKFKICIESPIPPPELYISKLLGISFICTFITCYF